MIFSICISTNMGLASSWLRLSKRALGESVRSQGQRTNDRIHT